MVAHARHLFVAFVALSGLALASCGKKDQDPETIPVGGSASAATVAAEQPAATGTAVTPTVVTPPQPRPVGANIDGCCAGINAVKTSGKDAIAKSKAAGAALACPGIAKAVKDGRTSRADGLTQIKALLQGTSVPECN